MVALFVAIIFGLCCEMTLATETIRLLVLLPKKKGNFYYPFGMERTGAAVAVAVEEIEADGVLGNRKFEIDYRDTKCNDVYALGSTSTFLQEKNYSGIIGPQCSGVCRHVGRLAAYHNIPCFTGVCQDTEMLNKNIFNTLTRFLGTFDKVGLVVKGLLTEFKWKRIGIIAQKHTDKIWFYTRDAVMEMAEANDIDISLQKDYNADTDSLEDILVEVASVSRVIVLAVRGETLRSLMLLAYRLGMTTGDYMFLCVYYYAQKNTFGDLSWKQKNRPSTSKQESQIEKRHDQIKRYFQTNDANDIKAKSAYKSLIFISYFTPKTSRYRQFVEQVKNKSSTIFNYTYGTEEELPYPAANLYEAMHMYAISLNISLENGGNTSDGRMISSQLWGNSYSLITGNVTLNNNGDRQQGFKIEQIFDGNEFSLRETGLFLTEVGYFEQSPSEDMIWPGGQTAPPSDTPTCGYSGEFCRHGMTEQERLQMLIGVFVGIVVFVVLLSVVIQRVVVRKVRNQMNEMMWKIQSIEVMITKRSLFSLSRISIKDDLPVTQANSGMESGTYKGGPVMIKRFWEVTSDMPLDIKEFRQLRELENQNVAKIIGFCVEPNNFFTVTEFCQKGSLADILENEDINLDWDFKYCLLSDVLRGLEYIFLSNLRYHGNLKSTNCVVDSRFVLKLADIGPRAWLATKERCPRDLLWTAPEILRRKQQPSVHQGQSMDIYSLAILMHEIIQRNGPFGIEELSKTPDEIITLVTALKQPSFRPEFMTNTCPVQLENLIKACWEEIPSRRPSLKDIFKEISEISKLKTKKDSFFDNLLKRMEQYANNLEELVEERTSQYLTEKRKAEDLLYRLLPKSVAHQIQAHGFVEPEHFDSVTIMFSDIVEFTSLSAESSPMQIVAMLNDLYSAFDDIIDAFDVYKVETIGDAYMCVSGLPQRNIFHFTEVSKMSQSIMRMSEKFVIRHRPGQKLKLRVGIHTGSCVAGVIGIKMPRYCLFGDTVNTASRMESTSEAYRIQISDSTARLLSDTMKIIPRGEVEVKGKGKMTTYWLQWKEALPI